MRHALALILCLTAPVAQAHPHIFIDTQINVVFDANGRAAGVRLTWTYDDLFSLLLAEELGIDDDSDGTLTPEETTVLRDFVANWPPEFTGDLSVQLDGQALALARPQDHTVVMQDGRMVEQHLRPFKGPVAVTEPLAIRVFDKGYYTAYDVVAPIQMTGAPAGCTARYQAADIAAATDLVEELLYGRPASDFGPEEQFPEVGEAFADVVWVTCEKR